jgi:hypothetical protein
MRHSAVTGLILITVLPFVSCKKKTSSSLVNPGDNEIPASSSMLTASIAPNSLSEDQFDDALRNMTTAPNYVLIIVTDGNSGKQEAVCIDATMLVRAIGIERTLDLNEAEEFALKQEDRIYQFSNARAIKSLSRTYTESMLKDAREFLADKTIDEIDAATRDPHYKFYTFSAPEPGALHGKLYATALAHAVTERGILCMRTCFSQFRLDRRIHQRIQ